MLLRLETRIFVASASLNYAFWFWSCFNLYDYDYKANYWFSKVTRVYNDSMQQYGISPETLEENQDLSSFFKILTTSTDKDDKVVDLVTCFPKSIPKFPFSREEF